MTRLAPQKGVHLIKHAIHRTLEKGGQFILLGSSNLPEVQVYLLIHHSFTNFGFSSMQQHSLFDCSPDLIWIKVSFFLDCCGSLHIHSISCINYI